MGFRGLASARESEVDLRLDVGLGYSSSEVTKPSSSLSAGVWCRRRRLDLDRIDGCRSTKLANALPLDAVGTAVWSTLICRGYEEKLG